MGYKKQNSRLAKLLRTTALDELPQLINIIKGQMSFVGPRPLIPEEIPQDEIISFRLKVRPGLTGIAQILVSKEAPIFKKAEYDLWYIKNQSIGLDISLIFKSFWYSITRRWDRLGR
jgi:lipopolysaccharide/colanic/teichoic acid biosynthesis glycosyltransferase